MNIHYHSSIQFKKPDSDVLVFFSWKNDKRVFGSWLKKFDKYASGDITEIADAEDFQGEFESQFHFSARGYASSRRVLVVGLGDISTLRPIDVQEAASRVSRFIKSVKADSAAVMIEDELTDAMSGEDLIFHMTQGVALGQYSFDAYKSKNKDKKKSVKIEDITYISAQMSEASVVKASIKALQYASSTMFVRDLVNTNPTDTTPQYLAHVAKSLAKGKKRTSVNVLGPEEIASLGMGSFLAVARGSHVEPRFIEMSYKGGGEGTYILIGKGITFDTGGLSLKPSSGMETMKLDMAGAAAVLGVFSVLEQLDLKVNVVGLVPATENMPGPNATKPGDVAKAMNGKTIEILNTDAEGRLILADALSYVGKKYKKATAVIDLATLTGACVVALGTDYAGMFSNSSALARTIEDAAKGGAERLWQLPLPKEYKKLLKSDIADIRNIGRGRWGGAITAALFLEAFVPPEVDWAHIDIAGPAFVEKDITISPAGATGYGVKTLLTFLENVSGK